MAAGGDSSANAEGADAGNLGHGHILQEFKEINEVKSLIDGLKNIYNDQIAVEMSTERFTFIIDQYQEQPHLIDPHLEILMTKILDIVRDTSAAPTHSHLACKFLYFLTKLRGYKIIVRQFPHEVADVEPVLALLNKQDPKDAQTWESRYVLLLWMSMVCMIPFDLVRLDSNITSASGEKKKPVMDRILDMGRIYLLENDKCRDAAAYLVARFLSRPDVKKQRLPEFLDWSLSKLTASDVPTMQTMSEQTGILTMLALLFKFGKREDLLEYAPSVLNRVNELNLRDSRNTVMRKIGVKVIQRLGLIFLKNRIASWRYQRGSRSLSENLVQGKKSGLQSQSVNVSEEDEEYDIPEELEEIIEQLLGGLKDKDTIVRWSAAKGIGRITGRLPKELADDVVGSVLELFSLQETDGAWHGGCLCLAELGRRGLLLPQRLPDVVPVVIRSLEYDEKRGNFSVGANVRDSACYVCWAFARAYDPEEITPYVTKIANALVKASIYDREVNVRRAAAAAFQENVGRQGTFPHGIDILTTADYFAVGNRSNCYLELSVFVAQFDEYTLSMIEHLAQIKVAHWDSVMRELAAKGLHRLTSKAPDFMAKTVLPSLLPKTTGVDLFLRHGSILAMAEIVHALSILSKEQGRLVTDMISKEVVEGLRDITKTLYDAKLFRGYGGELMRKALMCMIEKLSLSQMPYQDDPVIDLWQEIIDDCLQHIEPEIQEAAVCAIPAFFEAYYKDNKGCAKPNTQEKIINKYLHELRTAVEISRMGYALALGVLPKFFLHEKFKCVLNGLMAATQITEKEKKWAEARRDAVKAVTGVCKTVGVITNGSPNQCLCSQNTPEVYESLFLAMTDYTLDSRGDVGAWVREAAMTGLQEITSLVVNTDPSLISPQISKQVFSCLVQQACEKIDRIRAHAGNIFQSLLYHTPEIPHVPAREQLKEVFPQEKLPEINWAAPSDTFVRFTQLLQCTAYKREILLGLTVSIGGLTESLVVHSSSQLQIYLTRIRKDQAKMWDFADVLFDIFESHIKVDRVSIPLLNMVDQLLSKGCFDLFIQDADDKFGMKMIDLVKKEISKSGDPNKIMSGANLLCGLLQFGSEARKKALTHLLILMCHRYPRVRKASANKLYEAMVTYDDIVSEESLDDAMNLVSETNWDGDLNEIKPLRNQLCDLLHIPRPVPLTKGDKKSAVSSS